jgi:uncharacterized protein (DUF885 family)
MRYNDRWTDRSLAAILARQAADRAALERLRAIDRAALAADQQLNYDCARETNARWVPDSICVTTMTRCSRFVPSPWRCWKRTSTGGYGSAKSIEL